MSKLPAIAFSKSAADDKGTLVFLVGEKGKLPASADAHNKDGRISNALSVAEFDGAFGAKVEIIAPTKGIDRILVVGLGKMDEIDEDGWMKIGGKIFAGKAKSATVTVMTDVHGKNQPAAGDMANIAAGAKLRAYSFDNYLTKKKDKPSACKITFVTSDDAAAKKAWKSADAVTDGVIFARDLVNEPANILGPIEFAEKASSLKKLGCDVQILDEKKLKSEKMGALLGVAQGSVRPARVAIIQWKGGKASEKPVAFVGKGVVFDSGGVSIKPAAGMEDMKGDMGGAAAVCGVMHALCRPQGQGQRRRYHRPC